MSDFVMLTNKTYTFKFSSYILQKLLLKKKTRNISYRTYEFDQALEISASIICIKHADLCNISFCCIRVNVQNILKNSA